MKVIDFTIPFSPFAGATFINCFASAYVYIEKIPFIGDDYECAKRTTGKCDGCGNCRNTAAGVQQKFFFIFDLVSGRSSLRCRFDDAPTEAFKLICEESYYDAGAENNIDFLFGYAGYDYAKVTCDFAPAIEASVNAGKPAIAKDIRGDFNIITGLDNICDIKTLYVFGDKIAPRYTFLDGLKRARYVMKSAVDEKLWNGYTDKMGLYTSDSLSKCSVDEKKARMERVNETMWHTFNCHNFAEVFRNRLVKELESPEFDEICNIISRSCGYTHDLAWALIGVDECADWTRHAVGYFGEMVELTLCRIQSNDIDVLEQVDRAIEILESKQA